LPSPAKCVFKTLESAHDEFKNESSLLSINFYFLKNNFKNNYHPYSLSPLIIPYALLVFYDKKTSLLCVILHPSSAHVVVHLVLSVDNKRKYGREDGVHIKRWKKRIKIK
jgi:hypothetical protein